MKAEKWEITQNRFVAFFDILGFKEMVESNSHNDIAKKLYLLRETIEELEAASRLEALKGQNIEDDQTYAVSFSDSIMFFSKSDKYSDALKIIFDCNSVIGTALENGIPIKGAIAYGSITVDFSKSLFFGRPIIDAYLLHEELQMMTAIFHHSFESKLLSYTKKEQNLLQVVHADFRSFLKSGRISHKIMRPPDLASTTSQIEALQKIYLTASGRHRAYIDNTLDFLTDHFEKMVSKTKTNKK